MKTKRLLSVAALILAGVVPILVGSALPAAAAHGVSRSDGNDAKGPLDLAGIRLTPIRSGDRLQVKTLSRFAAAQLDGDQGWIEVDFDTDGDRKIDYWVVTLYHKGKIVSVEGRGSSAIRYLPARRVDAGRCRSTSSTSSSAR
jgi:hypothetical protein